MDRLADSPWSDPGTVAGFAKSAPNAVLMTYAERERQRNSSARALDIGCGAGRNAIPLAQLGWEVVGTDLSWPMIVAARGRLAEAGRSARVRLLVAPMETLPLCDRSFDMVVAHGIWNLARSAAQFRLAVDEAARVSRPGAGLFVFTFSRHTLPPDAEPEPNEPFVFRQFSGAPQCFLTEAQLVAELGRAGFSPDDAVPRREYNRPQTGSLLRATAPVIFEAAFRRDP